MPPVGDGGALLAKLGWYRYFGGCRFGRGVVVKVLVDGLHEGGGVSGDEGRGTAKLKGGMGLDGVVS
jgi:hypothetical protein